MADSESNQPSHTVQDDANNLKYLDFVQVAALYAVVCFSTIYEYAKDNSGPLKPGVQTVQDTVKTVIGPVYHNLHDVPFELLSFVDRKVDEVITEVDHHVPLLLKQVSSQAISAVQKVPEMVRAVASEVQRAGVVDAASNIAKTMYTKYEPAAKEYYVKYEPVAEQYAVLAWSSLNQRPLFPQVAHIVVPTVAYWSEKYNNAVAYLADGGYTVSFYMPMIPVERMGKVFQAAENGTTNVVVCASVSSESTNMSELLQ